MPSIVSLGVAACHVLAVLGLVLPLSHAMIFVLAHWRGSGLFYLVGVDWGMFWGAAQAFISDSPASFYDLGVLERYLGPVHAYYGAGAVVTKVYPVPYPPVFILLVLPFSLLSPVWGYALWTTANFGLLTVTIAGLTRRLTRNRSVVIASTLLFWPLVASLIVGQAMGLLVFALWRAYVAWERGDDVRAGVWLGILLLKPQYLAPLALVLLLKRRWATVGGLAGTGAALLGSSLVILGPRGLFRYVTSVLGYADECHCMAPWQMVSWRGLLAATVPSLDEGRALAAIVLLSLATLAALPLIWRGSWEPRTPRFGLQILATLLVTLLVGYDVHMHGAALLVVPSLVALSAVPRHRWLPLLIGTGFYFPALAFWLKPPVSLAPESTLFGGWIICALLLILWHGRAEFFDDRPWRSNPLPQPMSVPEVENIAARSR